MSIPHDSSLTAARAASLLVVGQRLQPEEDPRQARSGPRPVSVSQPAPSRSERGQRTRSGSLSPPPLPRWSPGGSEGRFGPEGFEATDPQDFLRKGTGQWAHSVPPRSPTAEEQWQQRRREHEHERAASLSPPRPSGPHSAHASPEHPSRRGRSRSRSSAAASRSHSASASVPASPHPFLRAHTGGHAHPDLSPPRRHSQQHEYDGLDIELELSIDGSPEPQRHQQLDDSDQSPLRGLSPPPVQRYPFIRRTHEDSPVRASSQASPHAAEPTRAAARSSASAAAPSAPTTAQGAAAPTQPRAPQPGSTIASYIQRFRQQPPQPPSTRQASRPQFWWMNPGATLPPAATSAAGSAASASAPLVPPLPLPRQGTSTAEHLRRLEEQIDSQREEKRQQKLQQLAQQLNAEQEQENEQQQREELDQHDQQHQQNYSTLDGSNYSLASDYSLLEGLDPTSMMSPASPPHSGTHMDAMGAAAERASQPRQSILDDSDDFSALLPSRAQQQHRSPHPLSHSRSESALLPQRQRQAMGGVDLASSHDVDELLRRWRAERGGPPSAGGGAQPHTSSFLQDSPLPSPLVRPRRRSSPQISPARRGAGSVAHFASDENTTSADVERLIAGLKKRLGLDRDGELQSQQQQHYEPVSSYDRQQQQQQQQQHRPPLRQLDSQRMSPVRVPISMRDEASQCGAPDDREQAKPEKPRASLVSSASSSSSSSPPRQRAAAQMHEPLEALLERPRIAEQEYIDSARKAAEATPEPAAQDQAEQAVPRPVHPFPSVPPLRLPVGPSADAAGAGDASSFRSNDQSATARSQLDDRETARSAAAAMPPAGAEQPEHKRTERADDERKQPQSHSTPSRLRRSAVPVHTPAPRSVDAAIVGGSDGKADGAEGFRVELRRRRKRDGSCKRSRGPRGVISIHITPAVMTQLQQQQPVQHAPSAAEPLPAAASRVAADAAPPVQSAAPVPAPAAGASSGQDFVAASAPAAEAAGPSSVHFISNALPVTTDYSLPSSPARRAAAATAATVPGASAPSSGSDALLHEVVTRGLFCDPQAYSAILQQLVPASHADSEQHAHAAAGIPAAEVEQGHEEEQKGPERLSNEEEREAPQQEPVQSREEEQPRDDHELDAPAAVQAQQEAATPAQPISSASAGVPVAAAPTSATTIAPAAVTPAATAASAPYPYYPLPYGYAPYPPMPLMPGPHSQPFYPGPFYPPPPSPPSHMQHLYAQYYPPPAHMQPQAQGLPPPWNPWASAPPSAAIAAPAPAPRPHDPMATAPPLPPAAASSSVAPATSSAPLFSPSHAHLSRLCAELGMTVAEYYADPPLQQLVQQLDRLQTQQAQVQHMQQQQQQQHQQQHHAPIAHAHQA